MEPWLLDIAKALGGGIAALIGYIGVSRSRHKKGKGQGFITMEEVRQMCAEARGNCRRQVDRELADGDSAFGRIEDSISTMKKGQMATLLAIIELLPKDEVEHRKRLNQAAQELAK